MSRAASVASLFEAGPDGLCLSAGAVPSAAELAALVARLEARGLLPLYGSLLQSDDRRDRVDEGFRLALEGALAAGRAGAMRWEAVIEQVVGALNRVGVEPILLKGADLGFHVYPEIGLRTMTDLDLMVRPEELEVAGAALRDEGFRRIPTTFSDEWYAICRWQLPPYAHDELAVHVDVQASLLPPYSPYRYVDELDPRNLRPSRWRGASRLRPELLLWHVVVHSEILHLGHHDHAERATVDLLAMVAAGEEIDVSWLCGLLTETDTARALVTGLSRTGTPRELAGLLNSATRARTWPREAAVHAVHVARSLVPWWGLPGPRPPDAWYQIYSRPVRLLNALLRRNPPLQSGRQDP